MTSVTSKRCFPPHAGQTGNRTFPCSSLSPFSQAVTTYPLSREYSGEVQSVLLTGHLKWRFIGFCLPGCLIEPCGEGDAAAGESDRGLAVSWLLVVRRSGRHCCAKEYNEEVGDSGKAKGVRRSR